jgi:hypothetical protein
MQNTSERLRSDKARTTNVEPQTGSKSRFVPPISSIASLLAQAILLLRKIPSHRASTIANDLTPFVSRIVALRDPSGLRKGDE